MARSDFTLELKEKLPSYIVSAIEYVTAPIAADDLEGGPDNGEPT